MNISFVVVASCRILDGPKNIMERGRHGPINNCTARRFFGGVWRRKRHHTRRNGRAAGSPRPGRSGSSCHNDHYRCADHHHNSGADYHHDYSGYHYAGSGHNNNGGSRNNDHARATDYDNSGTNDNDHHNSRDNNHDYSPRCDDNNTARPHAQAPCSGPCRAHRGGLDLRRVR